MEVSRRALLASIIAIPSAACAPAIAVGVAVSTGAYTQRCRIMDVWLNCQDGEIQYVDLRAAIAAQLNKSYEELRVKGFNVSQEAEEQRIEEAIEAFVEELEEHRILVIGKP